MVYHAKGSRDIEPSQQCSKLRSALQSSAEPDVLHLIREKGRTVSMWPFKAIQQIGQQAILLYSCSFLAKNTWVSHTLQYFSMAHLPWTHSII